MNTRTGKLAAAVIAVLIAFPLGLVLLVAGGQSALTSNCGQAAQEDAKVKDVDGIPSTDLPYFKSAAAANDLGSMGWAYLAALNDDESDFGQSVLPGVHSGQNGYGAAGPMQIGIGGASTDNWDRIKSEVPNNLTGGSNPSTVYNEADAVYGGAVLLHQWGAPQDWLKALQTWNDYAPEINFVEQHVAEWTGSSAQQLSKATAASEESESEDTSAECAGSSPESGPVVAGDISHVEADGLAAIPQNAPAQVKAALEAGNEIIDDSYSNERTAGMLTKNYGSYDCSGSTDWILAHAGFDNDPLVNVGGQTAGDSSLLENFGSRGAGRWITLWANVGHVFIEVDGVVMDTAWYSKVAPTSPGTGPRWQPASIVPAQIQGDAYGGFTEVHPTGL